MSLVEPGYHLPSATYFTKVIELKYQEAVAKVLQGANYISVTSDMWTSLANDAYISLTTHYISKEWKMESVCLGTIPVSERHTGDNIALWIEEILEKFGISTEKVEHFKKSELATTALQKRQQQMLSDEGSNSTLQIVQDVKTRWNSVYYMIDRLLKLRLPISAVLADSAVTGREHCNLDLQSSSWDLLEQLKAVLYPFQVATTYLSSEYNVSISTMLPVIHGIVKNMQPDSGDPLLATFLDPRFKDTKFLAHSQKSSLESSIIYLINCCVSANSSNSDQLASSQSNQLSALDILLGEDNSTARSVTDNHAQVTEIVIYQTKYHHRNLLPSNGGKSIVYDTVYLYL